MLPPKSECSRAMIPVSVLVGIRTFRPEYIFGNRVPGDLEARAGISLNASAPSLHTLLMGLSPGPAGEKVALRACWKRGRSILCWTPLYRVFERILGKWILKVLPTHKTCNCVRWWVCERTLVTVVFTLQYILISNLNIVHLKLNMTFNANTTRKPGVTAADLVISVIRCHPLVPSGWWSDLWTDPRTSNVVFPLPRSSHKIRNNQDHFLAGSTFLFHFAHSSPEQGLPDL